MIRLHKLILYFSTILFLDHIIPDGFDRIDIFIKLHLQLLRFPCDRLRLFRCALSNLVSYGNLYDESSFRAPFVKACAIGTHV